MRKYHRRRAEIEQSTTALDYSTTVQNVFPESRKPPPAYPISSVDNALRLLLLFREQRSVRLTDACKYLDVAHSTAHRLLAMLTYHGFVQQEAGSRAYIAGPALIDVGLAVVRTLDVREEARGALERLSEEFDETTHLAVLEGAMVRYLESVEGSRALRVTQRTGRLSPAHCTSVGKAMLAAMTEDQFLDTYPADVSELEVSTPESIATHADLVREIHETRERGYAVNRGESEEGVGSVAIAFRDIHGRLAGIAVAAPLSRLDDDRLAAMGRSLGDVALALGRVSSTAP